MVVGARQIFNFSDKKPGFLEIIEVCLNLGIRFCITWLVLPNYKKIVRKNQFHINHASHLKFETDFLEKENPFQKTGLTFF